MPTATQIEKSKKLIENHVQKIRGYINILIFLLGSRARTHDNSKFKNPEFRLYAKHVDEIIATKYGTPEYYQLKKGKLAKATNAHISKNRHHPEHWPNGINDMDLIDVIEMVCDWVAAAKRENGNFLESLEHETKKLNLSPQLVQILKNTFNRYFKL